MTHATTPEIARAGTAGFVRNTCEGTRDAHALILGPAQTGLRAFFR